MEHKVRGSNNQDFSSLANGISWLTMQGQSHPRFFVIAMMQCPGFAAIFAMIMAGVYPGASGDISFLMTDWEDFAFVVLSLPIRDGISLERFLKEQPMPFVLSEGEPTRLLTPGQSDDEVLIATNRKGKLEHEENLSQMKATVVSAFPFTGENVFTLEEYREKRGPFISFLGLMPGEKA